MLRPKCPPIAARSTLGDQHQAVWGVVMIRRTPAAALLRRMAPTLPGSWIRSRTTVSSSTLPGNAGAGVRTTASTGAGDGIVPSPSNRRSWTIVGTTPARATRSVTSGIASPRCAIVSSMSPRG